jgi:alkylated DNA repair dioxygenase AlkB
MTTVLSTITCAVQHVVFDRYAFLTSCLPVALDCNAHRVFEELWALHPAEFYEMRQPGTSKMIPVPRLQQAYGHDYRYSGNVNRALPIAPILAPFLTWAQATFDGRLNGLLLNWYDAELAHRIGPHRDSTSGLVEGSHIVTISLGATRVFRLSPGKGKGFVDFEAEHGTVFVLPWETNLHVKHSVPHRACDIGRRISITLRAFGREKQQAEGNPTQDAGISGLCGVATTDSSAGFR